MQKVLHLGPKYCVMHVLSFQYLIILKVYLDPQQWAMKLRRIQ